MGLEITRKTWWSLRFWPRDRGSALRLVASTAIGLVLFFPWAIYPAAAAGDDLQVIAVNTASAPHVSMVVEPPATAQQNGSEEESCTVTIDGESVATTVRPMASGDLSVALVFDTASDLTPQELRAVKNGAIDFLLGLPQEANTMVVTAGGKPQVVAPLNAHPAEALSAISALEVGGSRATSAATRLAAESLQSSPPGPRVIIVYTHGPDEQGPSVERLSEAVLQANAVVHVIPAGAESIWPSVVERTGGVVLPPTGDADIAQSYGRLSTMLSEQYLVTFQAPDELPAVAQVTFQSADQEYTTVVNLPDADTEQAAPTEERGIVRLVSLVVAGLIVLVVLGLVLRTRRRASVGGSPPAEAAAPPAGTPLTPALAMQATEKEGAGRPSNGAPASTVAAAPATPPRQAPSRRGSLTAAVQGRRTAEHAVNAAPEQQVPAHPPDDQQPTPVPAGNQPQHTHPRLALDERRPVPLPTQHSRHRNPVSGRDRGAEPPQPNTISRAKSVTPPRRADWLRRRRGRDDQNHLVPAVVHISGNAASEYFAVRTLGTNNDLVMTMEPYDGIRPLDWDGDESTGFEISATGPWRIEMLPLSAIPTFTGSFNGKGNMVVHFTGDGSLARDHRKQ